MPVYIDRIHQWLFGENVGFPERGVRMHAVFADTSIELSKMAESLNVGRNAIEYRGTSFERFYLSHHLLKRAIKKGCILIELRRYGKIPWHPDARRQFFKGKSNLVAKSGKG